MRGEAVMGTGTNGGAHEAQDQAQCWIVVGSPNPWLAAVVGAHGAETAIGLKYDGRGRHRQRLLTPLTGHDTGWPDEVL